MHTRFTGLLLLTMSAALLAIGVAPSLSRPLLDPGPRPVAVPLSGPGECCDETRGWCPPEGFSWQDCKKNC